MSAKILDGKAIAEQIHAETRLKVNALKEKGIQPAITFIRVGEDPASAVYVRMKDRKAQELGILAETLILPESTTEAELIQQIHSLNQNPAVHGILVQAPLPPHISETNVFAAVAPEKDVDGFHPVNTGKLLLGDETGFRPCTPAGVQELLVRSGIEIEGKHVVILGRGNIVGKPLFAIFCQKKKNANATVTILHSRSRNIPEYTRQADILVAAMGQAEFVKADMVKPGAVVVDVGVNRLEDASAPKGYRLVGDVAFEAVQEVASAITPNPGGAGPMTIAVLMANTVRAASL